MKHLLTLCIGFFMLLSCNNKPSQSAAIATDEPEVNEDTLFRVIDLANNLKPCSDSLLLSDIVEDVEYVKLETADRFMLLCYFGNGRYKTRYVLERSNQ